MELVAAQWFFGAAVAAVAAIALFVVTMSGILYLCELRLSQQNLEARISRGIACPTYETVLVPVSCLSDSTFDKRVHQELTILPKSHTEPHPM